MLKKIFAITAAAAMLVMLLPDTHGDTYGGDPGNVYIGVKDSERYYHRLKNLRRNDPENAEVDYKIGNYYYARQMFDKSIEEYRRALKKDPNHEQAKWFLAQSLINKNHYEEAFWLVRDLIDKHRNDADLYDQAGEILVKMGEYAASKEYFAKVDEIKYGEKDGRQPISSFTKPGRGSWKNYYF